MCSLNHALKLYREDNEPESCTHCGLDRIEEENPLIFWEDESPELICLRCMLYEGRIFKCT